MPIITAQGKSFACPAGANLRQVLLANGVDLYSPRARYINCMGIGTCGTCAIAVEGEVSEVNWRDRTRRALPPHTPDKNLRLACQTCAVGDVSVTKFAGFWGHESEIVWGPEGTVLDSN